MIQTPLRRASSRLTKVAETIETNKPAVHTKPTRDAGEANSPVVSGVKRRRAQQSGQTDHDAPSSPVDDAPLCLITAAMAALHPAAIQQASMEPSNSPVSSKTASRALSGQKISAPAPSSLSPVASPLPSPPLPSSPLLCRESESLRLSSLLSSLLGEGRAGSLYVCGSPGVGKTAVLTRTLASLPDWCRARDLPLPSVHFLNATPMLSSLRSKSELFDEIANRIYPDVATAKRARLSATTHVDRSWIEAGKRDDTDVAVLPANTAAGSQVAAAPVADALQAALMRTKLALMKPATTALMPLSSNSANGGKKKNAKSAKLKYHIVVVDELDVLLDRSTAGHKRTDAGIEVLYNLFAWPRRTETGKDSNRVILIGIANAVDMTERFLPYLKTKGLQPQTLMFAPYTPEQITSIVRERLNIGVEALIQRLAAQKRRAAGVGMSFEADQLMDPAAITMIAKRVSNASGDMRRALEICATALGTVASRYCSCSAALQLIASAEGTSTDSSDIDEAASVDSQETCKEIHTPSKSSSSQCSCLELPWQESGSGSAAVAVPDAGRLLAAAYGNRYGKLLKALPRQAQILVCAARALAVREGKRKLIAESRAANKHLLVDDFDTPAVDVTESLGSRKPSASTTKTPSSNSTITVEQLEDAYKALCKRINGAASGVSRSEFRDLVDRLLSDGLLASAHTSKAVSSHLSVNIATADLDIAYSASPFYSDISQCVHSGLV